MSRASAFAVVGHRSWGKSTTLRALAGKPGWVTVNDQKFFVRLMSNDDIPDDYEEFVDRLEPKKKPYLLLAYCPERGRPWLLEALGKKYRLNLFVLEQRAAGGDRLTEDEIKGLRGHGKMRVFDKAGASPKEIAADLRSFIAESL